MEELYSAKINIEAQSANKAIEICRRRYKEDKYEEFECVGETIPSTNGNPGFFKILGFESSESYHKWQSE
jgi:hypothetical protein